MTENNLIERLEAIEIILGASNNEEIKCAHQELCFCIKMVRKLELKIKSDSKIIKDLKNRIPPPGLVWVDRIELKKILSYEDKVNSLTEKISKAIHQEVG